MTTLQRLAEDVFSYNVDYVFDGKGVIWKSHDGYGFLTQFEMAQLNDIASELFNIRLNDFDWDDSELWHEVPDMDFKTAQLRNQ